MLKSGSFKESLFAENTEIMLAKAPNEITQSATPERTLVATSFEEIKNEIARGSTAIKNTVAGRLPPAGLKLGSFIYEGREGMAENTPAIERSENTEVTTADANKIVSIVFLLTLVI